MKFLPFVFLAISLLPGCGEEPDEKRSLWEAMDDYPGSGISAGYGVVGEKGYVILLNDFYPPNGRPSDIWIFDPANTPQWTSKKCLVNGLVFTSFVINGELHVLTDYVADRHNPVHVSLHYKYDPSNNTWKELASPPLKNEGYMAIDRAVVGTKAYLGVYENTVRKFYSFDAVSGQWSQLPDCPSKGPLLKHNTFVFNDKLIVVDITESPKVWQFDTITSSWSEKTPVPSDITFPSLSNAMTFSLGSKGYFIGGLAFGGVGSSAQGYEYDFALDKWTALDYQPTEVELAAGIDFLIKGQFYCGPSPQKKFWRYTPYPALPN